MKRNLPKLGGQLGVALCAIGFLLVFLGWNGAASRDRVPAQFPYLISGGIAGLCLVVMGVGLIVVQNHRTDRVALQSSLDRLREAVERGGGVAAMQVPEDLSGLVVAGRSSFHRPDCHLASGRDDAEVLAVDDAVARGLDACRVCDPTASTSPPAPRRTRQLRARTRSET